MWIKTRVIAEIARSSSLTNSYGSEATAEAICGAPELRAIADWIVGNSEAQTRIDSEESYIAGRVDEQISYYESILIKRI